MAQHTVLVVGSSGNVGENTLKLISEKYSSQLKTYAGVRNPEKAEKLKALKGIEVVKADPSSPDELAATIQNLKVDTVFVITPGSEDREKLAAAGVHAAKKGGAKAVVVVSVLTAELTNTVFGSQFTPLEKQVKEAGIPYTLLRLPLFIDNNWAHVQSIKGQNTFYGPGLPNKPYTPVAVADIARAAVAVLLNPAAHANKTYKLVSDRFTNEDLAAAFSEALGRTITYTHVPWEAAEASFKSAGFASWQVTGIFELLKLIDSDSPVTNEADLGDFEKITGEKPTSLKQWVAAVAPAFK